jgi:outer membrane protein TolC
VCLPLFNACVPQPRIQITDETDLSIFEVERSYAHNQNSILNVKNIPARVRNNHPQLIAARKAIDVSKGKLSQSGRLENPELEISTSKDIPSSTGEIELDFSQRFPVTNKLSLEKRVHKDAIKIAQTEVRIIEYQLGAQAQLLALEILGKDREHALLEKQKNAYQSVVDWIFETAKRGEISELEANVPQLEIKTIELKQKQLLSQKQLLTQQLKGLVGMPANRPLVVQGSLPQSTIPSRSLNLQKHPLYIAKKQVIAQSKSNVLLEKAKRYEDPELKFTGSLEREEDVPEGLETEGSIGIGLSIPLPLYDKNEGNIKAATAQVETDILELNALSASIKNQAAEHKLAMQNWLKQNAEIKTSLLPFAKKNTEQLEKAYQQGQGDYLSFLQASKQTIELEQQLLENSMEFHRARVRYFNAIGHLQSTF